MGSINNIESKKEYVHINDLNFLRVFALSLVILRHSFAPFLGIWDFKIPYEQSEMANIIGKYISTISMPLYVFISGVLFSYLRNGLNKYPTYQILIQKKIKRLIRPYLFLAPLYIYFFMEFHSSQEFLLHLWEGAGHLWFLLMIFTVFLVFYPLETYFKAHPIKGFGFVTVLFCLFPLFSFLGLYPISKAFQYFPYFFVGYFFYYNSKEILIFLKNKFWLLIVLHTFIFAASIGIPEFIHNARINKWFSKMMLFPMGILSVSFVFLFFTKLKDTKLTILDQPIKNINAMSYYIYLLHQPLLILFFGFDFLANWKVPYVIILSFTLVLFVSLLLSNIIMHFKWGRQLIGAD